MIMIMIIVIITIIICNANIQRNVTYMYAADICHYITTEFEYAKRDSRFAAYMECCVATAWIYKGNRHYSWNCGILTIKLTYIQASLSFRIVVSLLSSIQSLLSELYTDLRLYYEEGKAVHSTPDCSPLEAKTKPRNCSGLHALNWKHASRRNSYTQNNSRGLSTPFQLNSKPNSFP